MTSREQSILPTPSERSQLMRDQEQLNEALRRDNEAESAGMHGDDRRTCWQCSSWADHAHDRTTNERLPLEEYRQRWDPHHRGYRPEWEQGAER